MYAIIFLRHWRQMRTWTLFFFFLLSLKRRQVQENTSRKNSSEICLDVHNTSLWHRSKPKRQIQIRFLFCWGWGYGIGAIRLSGSFPHGAQIWWSPMLFRSCLVPSQLWNLPCVPLWCCLYECFQFRSSGMLITLSKVYLVLVAQV